MSNIDRAADVIDQWTQEGNELNHAVGSPHAIAERLADAGLLVPDTTGTLASMWARGKAQLADLALLKASGAPIPEWAYERAPKGDVNTGPHPPLGQRRSAGAEHPR